MEERKDRDEPSAGEEALSRYIDELLAERTPVAHDSGGMQGDERVYAAVRAVKALREPFWPEPSFPERIIGNLRQRSLPQRHRHRATRWLGWGLGTAAAAGLVTVAVLGFPGSRPDRFSDQPPPRVPAPAHPNAGPAAEKRKSEVPFALNTPAPKSKDPASHKRLEHRAYVPPFRVEVTPAAAARSPEPAVPPLVREMTAGEPLALAAGGTQLPVRLTWTAVDGRSLRPDAAGTTWTLLSAEGERIRQPLRITGPLVTTAPAGAPVPWQALLDVPIRPGWYTVFLEPRAELDGKPPVQGSANSFRLFVPHPPERIRAGVLLDLPGSAESRATHHGIRVELQRINLTGMAAEVLYRMELPEEVRGLGGHLVRASWDGGRNWVEPVVDGYREGPPGAAGSVRSITGQAVFPPAPRSARRLLVRIPAMDVIVPDGGPYGSVQTRRGPWIIAADLPEENAGQ